MSAVEVDVLVNSMPSRVMLENSNLPVCKTMQEVAFNLQCRGLREGVECVASAIGRSAGIALHTRRKSRLARNNEAKRRVVCVVCVVRLNRV